MLNFSAWGNSNLRNATMNNNTEWIFFLLLIDSTEACASVRWHFYVYEQRGKQKEISLKICSLRELYQTSSFQPCMVLSIFQFNDNNRSSMQGFTMEYHTCLAIWSLSAIWKSVVKCVKWCQKGGRWRWKICGQWYSLKQNSNNCSFPLSSQLTQSHHFGSN